MDLNEIEAMWKIDSQIDLDNIEQETAKIPQLHGKYHEISTIIYKLKADTEFEYNKMLLEKTLYYTGRADPKIMNKDPFNLQIPKGEAPIFLNADVELAKLKSKIDYLKFVMYRLEDIIKMIHNRSFQIRHILDCRKFEAGQ
jgi:hypothetical protein